MQAFRRLGWVLFTAALTIGGRAAAQFVVPEYHSFPGAAKRLYLDFDGHDMAVPGYTPKVVTGASKGNNNCIRLTVPGHGLKNYDGQTVLEWPSIIVKDIVGTIPGVNSTWWDIYVHDANNVELRDTVFSGSYTSGGTIRAVRKWDGAQVGELVPGSNPMKFVLPTVPFSLDSDATTLNAQELAYIEAIWRVVAEDYAPFNVDVTTKEPANWSDTTDTRVVFDDHAGDKGDWWTADWKGGRAIIGSFTSSAPNVAFVWHKYYTSDGGGSDNVPRVLGLTASHEAGHGFGLRHITTWHENGGKFVGQIMSDVGFPGYRERHVWSYGGTDGGYQDGLQILSGPTNLDYRLDDHGDTVGTATVGSQSGSKCWSSGVDCDGDVDQADYTTLQSNFGTGTTWAQGDCDGDGDVDLDDFAILSANYNAGTNYRNWP